MEPSGGKKQRKHFRNQHAKLTILLLAVALVVCFVVALALGRFQIPLVQAVRILLSRLFSGIRVTWTPQMENVLIGIRLPRMFGAALVGAALALSGSVYQSIFKNPLVSPDLLGVSSGACVGAAAAKSRLHGQALLQVDGHAVVGDTCIGKELVSRFIAEG